MGLAVKDYLPKLGVTRFSVTNPKLAFPFFERFFKRGPYLDKSPIEKPASAQRFGLFRGKQFFGFIYRVDGR